MKMQLRLTTIVIFGAAVGASQVPATRSLKDLFQDPPHEYSMEPFWSLNATLEKDKLIWQMDQMREQGVYGAFMHARDGLDQSRTPYFSEGFWNGIQTIVDHARQTGFRTWIYDEDKWPSGDAGGRTRAANPERFSAAPLAYRSLDVHGPDTVRLDFPKARFVLAARKESASRIVAASLVDLTGKPVWAAPPGDWRVSVFEPAQLPQPLPNYINPAAVKEFLNNTYEQYAARFSGDFGKTIPGSFFDEIYNRPVTYDPLLEERFRAHKGYELLRSLPLLFEDGGPTTIKFRCDYFDELTKLYVEAWFGQLSEWCARHNLKLKGHTLEDLSEIPQQGDYFRTWRVPQVPGTDNEDFRYTFPRVIGSWKPKQLSSVTHVYGKPRAMVEALGGAGWTITLDQARYGVNMLAVFGINDFVFHLFHYAQDTPASMDDWPNSWFYQNPYWKYFKKLADYTRRLSFVGSQGAHVADIAILYPVEEVWSQGIVAPRKDEPVAVSLVDGLARTQQDCDLVDTDSIVRSASVAGGQARIGAETYRVLVLPGVETVSLKAYRRIAELAEQGLKVIAVGKTPRHSAENGAADPEVMRISGKLFPGGRSVLKDSNAAVEWLRGAIPADLRVESGDGPALRFFHRRIDGRSVYFLVNSEQRPLAATVRFAASGGAERWNPEDGSVESLPVEWRDQRASRLQLTFEPWQAYYVVFDPAAPVAAPKPAGKIATAIALDGPWTFQLAPVELDTTWKPEPGETRVEAPVADFRLEGGDRSWRRVKLADSFNPVKGAGRYVSAWDAAWITRYFYQRNHPGELAGPELRFSKDIEVPFEARSARVAIVADGKAECAWNGAPLRCDGPALEPMVLDLPAAGPKSRLEITVKGNGYLLAQGEVQGPDGCRVAIRSGGDWLVASPGLAPLAAYEFARPPLGKWGEPALPGASPVLPARALYRVTLPPGAEQLEAPRVRGRFQMALDGQPLAAGDGAIPLPQERRAGSELTLTVELAAAEDGLQGPLVFHCGKREAALGDWTRQGLDWYSGRGVYGTSFHLSPAQAGGKLVLDLGDLRYTGEVWVNGRLVGTLGWPPYRVKLGDAVRAGDNQLVVVVANLLANQMRWNIFDSAISAPTSRWWHDGNILRESDKLQSGLLGPVRLLIAE